VSRRYIVAKTFWDTKNRDRGKTAEMLGRYAKRYKPLCPKVEIDSDDDEAVKTLGMRGFYMIAWGSHS
jgi:hypothetical protein